MHSLWMAALLLAAPPAGNEQNQPQISSAPAVVVEAEALYELDAETAAAHRSAYDLKAQISETLRREATTEGDENLTAVLELVALYQALLADTNLAQDESLRLKAQVRSRLMKIASSLKHQLRREELAEKARLNRERRLNGPSVASRSQSESVVESSLKEAYANSPGFRAAETGVANASLNAEEQDTEAQGLALPKQTLLFQIGAALGQQPQGAEAMGEALIEVIKGATGQGKWDDQGGPGSIRLWKSGSLMKNVIDPLRQAGVNALAGAIGGRAVDDHGPELVELIETVIAPNTWDKNGGFGSIFYYAPLRVIVVRTTGDVHGHVGNVLGNLRAAGN